MPVADQSSGQRKNGLDFTYWTVFRLDRQLTTEATFGPFEICPDTTLEVTGSPDCTKISFKLITNARTDAPETFQPDGKHEYWKLHQEVIEILDWCATFVFGCHPKSPSLHQVIDRSPYSDFDERYAEWLAPKTPLRAAVGFQIGWSAKVLPSGLELVVRLTRQCFSHAGASEIMAWYAAGAASGAIPYVYWYKILEELKEQKRAGLFVRKTLGNMMKTS